MPEAAPDANGAPATTRRLDDEGLPLATLWHLLGPKWLTARSRMLSNETGRGTRLAILGVTGALFWYFLYYVLYRVLVYFRDAQDIGALLAGKLMGLILIGFFSILLLSNIIGALSTYFLARDLDMLVSAPVDWLRFYAAKLVETLAHSSWMVLLLSIPIFTAYGVAYKGGWLYPLVAIATFIPFIVLPAVVGSVVTLILVNVFPAQRTKDILTVIAVLAAAGLALLFRLVRPERLARPEGYQSLVDFVAELRTPTSPFLPSEWAQDALMSYLTGAPNALSFYLLWSTAAAFIILGAKLHGILYPLGYTRAQESGTKFARQGMVARGLASVLSVFGTTRRELLLKEIRIFFRDTTQWSQLILLGVLVVVYVFNITFLPLRGDGVSSVLVNVLPFLNLGLSGFVIASVAARFIFPAVSLEGRTIWLLRSSPLRMRELLWSKFWVGTAPLIVLALLIVGLTNYFMGVGQFMFLVSILTIAFMTIAIASLALCLGTVFPQFDTENAAQIPTSFGGLVFMMSSIALIGAIIWLEARPVYLFLESQTVGDTVLGTGDMVFGFGSAFLLCALATIIPIQVALYRMERIER